MQPGVLFLSCSGQWPGIFMVLLLIAAEKAIDRVKQERSQQAIIDWQNSGPSRCIRDDRPRRDGIEEDIDQHGAAAKRQGRQHYCLQSDVTGAKQQLPASMPGKGSGRGQDKAEAVHQCA